MTSFSVRVVRAGEAKLREGGRGLAFARAKSGQIVPPHPFACVLGLSRDFSWWSKLLTPQLWLENSMVYGDRNICLER